MIILITGASHTGKTALAQKLLETYKYPYLSIDHLKMGLIRSGNTDLTPLSDDKDLTAYLWPIVSEMVKTAIENEQNLIVEGCYIPFDWQKDFDSGYLENIRYYCLVMSEGYIRSHFDDIKGYASTIEHRMDDEWYTMESALEDNARMLALAQKHDVNYILIDDKYEISIDLQRKAITIGFDKFEFDGENMDYYKQIFKRKSFHIFKNTDMLTESEVQGLKDFIKTTKPLNSEIKTEICIVPESETTCKRGGQYCILFYSETKGEYLRNIGYIGEQIDLYLASQNIGALWFGIGKPQNMQVNGLDFVIMISIAKMPEDMFRKDMFKSKRKPLNEIWSGDTLGVAEIVRFTPSACNTQPWIVENTGNNLMIYRFKKPGKRGIMPADKVRYYNKIDMGIFLFMLEACLEHEGYAYERTILADTTDDSIEQTLIAKYTYSSK